MGLRVGVFGAGAVSGYHIAAYQEIPDVTVVAICDTNRARAEQTASQYGISNAYSNADAFLDNKLDAVSICTSNETHSELSCAALDAGVNVLCEKPPARNLAEAERMLASSRKSKKLLMMGFGKRFEMASIIVKQFVDRGFFGEFYSSRTATLRRCGNPGGWFADASRSGGGPMLDLGLQSVDLIRYLMGKPKATTVSASCFRKLGLRGNIENSPRWKSADFDPRIASTVEDQATAFIRFDNGATLVVDVSYSQHIDAVVETQMDLFGTKAGVSMMPTLRFATEQFDQLTTVTPYVPPDSLQARFGREIAHFVACVRGEDSCISPPEDGLAVMAIANAVYESARLGKEVEL